MAGPPLACCTPGIGSLAYVPGPMILLPVLGQIGFAISREVPPDGVVDALTELLHSHSAIRLDARRAVQAVDNPMEVGAMMPAESWSWLQRTVGKLGLRPFIPIGSIHTACGTTSIIINGKRP